MVSNREILSSFSLEEMPTLDVAVLGALELFQEYVPELPTLPEGRVLIVGSVNAAATGKVLGQKLDAVFADESDYKEVLEKSAPSAALLISASGGKHAVPIARHFKEKGVRTILITHSENAPAAQFLEPNNVVVFPKNREPYTYNTSTYLGVILASTKENPKIISEFIETIVAPSLPSNLSEYDAFYMTVPSRFNLAVPMLLAKFDELFAPRVSGRVFTVDHAMHATTVVPSDTECFIHFGENPGIAPKGSLQIPLPENADYATLIAITYYVIGVIQSQHPPYFKENIVSYCDRASKLFGQNISPIVA